MKREAIYWLTLATVVAIAGSSLYQRYQSSRPCAQPIAYTIGSVDSRFNISDAKLLTEIEAAAAIWNKAAGKTLLAYDPKAAMKINLIYDTREAVAKLGSDIALKQADEDAARATLDASQTQFAAEQSAYNQEVRTINARGGATPAEVVALEQERAALEVFSQSINREVADYNSSVTALNAVIAQYNQTAGHTFEEGEFVRDSTGERIDIFEFIGASQLERVLVHELGHAIGLGHNANPRSIMFAQNESGNLEPTPADLAALKAVCGLN